MKLFKLIQRMTSRIMTEDSSALEGAVRSLLIFFHFHTSNRGVIHFIGTDHPHTVCAVTPIQFHGEGKVCISSGVVFGVVRSCGNLATSYVDARTKSSVITFGKRNAINNGAIICSEGASITLGDDCLVGPYVHISDSNSHELAVSMRRMPDSRPRDVVIGNDVFIGSRVTILKGVTIGNGCVIAAGSVLLPGFTAEEGSVIAGNPAVVIRKVPTEIGGQG